MAAAVSIGIGGMVGAGIFSILGVVAEAAGNAMWLAFAIGGVVALLSTYSYAKLGATFPSAGGAVHFLVKSFGDGVLAGGLNLFMWAGTRGRFSSRLIRNGSPGALEISLRQSFARSCQT